ncbi:glycoside hydrolase [Rhodobacter phage RcMenchie]|nr:glycoside hydrolase [Rhodobacter phage RcMenchie]
MAILRAMNKLSDFDASMGFRDITTAGYFDTTYGISSATSNTELAAATDASYLEISGLAESLSEGVTLWIHFRLYGRGKGTSSSALPFLAIYDLAGSIPAAIVKPSGGSETFRLRVSGTTTVTSSMSLALAQNTLYTFDVSLTLSGGVLTFSVYLDGTLWDTRNTPYVHSASKLPDKIRIIPAGISYGVVNTCAISELIVATQNTIGMHLAPLPPTANGDFAEWVGQVSYLTDAALDTGLQASAANARHSWTVPAYTAALSIVAVAANFRAYSPTESGTGLTPFLRLSSTNYDGVSVPLTAEKFIHPTWNTNPATGAAWAAGDIGGLQIGVKAS